MYLQENIHSNILFLEPTPTVSAQLERRGSIFQKGFLGEVQFEFNIPGVLIKKEDKVKCFSTFYIKYLLFGIQESVPTL